MMMRRVGPWWMIPLADKSVMAFPSITHAKKNIKLINSNCRGEKHVINNELIHKRERKKVIYPNICVRYCATRCHWAHVPQGDTK